jgi:hypothetical protein
MTIGAEPAMLGRRRSRTEHGSYSHARMTLGGWREGSVTRLQPVKCETHPSNPPAKNCSRVSFALSNTAFRRLTLAMSRVFFVLSSPSSISSGRAGGDQDSSVAAQWIEEMGSRSDGEKLNESRRCRSGGESTSLMTRIRPSPGEGVRVSETTEGRGGRRREGTRHPFVRQQQQQSDRERPRQREACRRVERWPWP